MPNRFEPPAFKMSTAVAWTYGREMADRPGGRGERDFEIAAMGMRRIELDFDMLDRHACVFTADRDAVRHARAVVVGNRRSDGVRHLTDGALRRHIVPLCGGGHRRQSINETEPVLLVVREWSDRPASIRGVHLLAGAHENVLHIAPGQRRILREHQCSHTADHRRRRGRAAERVRIVAGVVAVGADQDRWWSGCG